MTPTCSRRWTTWSSRRSSHMRFARLIRNRVIGLVRRARQRAEAVRPRRARTLELETMRRRLEILLRAMYNEPLGDGLTAEGSSAKAGERSIILPRSLPDTGDAAERYRLLAIEQGARVARGTRTLL